MDLTENRNTSVPDGTIEEDNVYNVGEQIHLRSRNISNSDRLTRRGGTRKAVLDSLIVNTDSDLNTVSDKSSDNNRHVNGESADTNNTSKRLDKKNEDLVNFGSNINPTERKRLCKDDAGLLYKDASLSDGISSTSSTHADTPMSQMQASVLQALGLTHGSGVGFANALNVSKNLSLITSEHNKVASVSLSSSIGGSTSLATKTVPLLVNMKGGATGPPSLLPANLPPGRYVIISSTTAASSTSPLTTTLTTTSSNNSITTTTTTNTTATAAASRPVGITTNNGHTINVSTGSTTTNNNKQLIQQKSSTRFSLVRHMTGLSSAGRLRTPVGRTRGMRKSYTTSEKLAMIEAVESGLKKSVVADAFGVAPSTLACIILQRDKIRRDQASRLGRNRFSSNLHIIVSLTIFIYECSQWGRLTESEAKIVTPNQKNSKL